MPIMLAKQNWRAKNFFTGISLKTCLIWVTLTVSKLMMSYFRRVLLQRNEYALEKYHIECKTIPVQFLTGPEDVRSFRLLDFETWKWFIFSALCTGQYYPQENILGIHICYNMSRFQGHRAAGSFMTMKNSHSTIENPNRDTPLVGQCLTKLRPSPSEYKPVSDSLTCKVKPSQQSHSCVERQMYYPILLISLSTF